ncbi:flagellar hook-length control protein FliK [Persephonella atlantica]|uniref:Flagellar hook-length control protein FliK n=1 Tax=Persephonella atlantica TaxID=2699429 RepID=A0ABS1GJS4_9AQUI|nr:hypothetical protein [Persephonella atlantica]MBK3333081.1 flagellar hook-length control protein FliK [Persephonella atlantica]
MINFKPLISNYEFFQIVKPLGKSIHLKAGETVKAEVIDILPTGGVVLRMKGGLLTVETDIPLQKDTTLLLKILDTSPQHRLKIQVVGILDKNNTAVQLLNLQQLKVDELISALKNTDTENILLSQIFSMSTSSLTEKERSMLSQLLISIIKNSSFPHNIKHLFTNLQSLEPSRFQHIILNSGVFYENKVKNRKFEQIKNDFKYIAFSTLSEEREKIIKTIDSYQLLSKLTGGVFTFIPLMWDEMKRGDIFFKKSKKGKNLYFCRIDLELKNLGRIVSGIFMFGKELHINFYIEDENLREIIQKSADTLMQNLKKYNFSHIYIKMLKTLPEEKKFIDEDFLRLKV